MGAFTFTDEYSSLIPPARSFKALIADSHNLIPKLWPQAIKSINILQGDGGPGTIKQINFVEASPAAVKSRGDVLNEENFTYKHTTIDLNEWFESIAYEVQFEPKPDGGSKSRMTRTYHVKGDVELKEEDIKAGQERAWGMFKVAEAYLLQNPKAYA